jgi:hypothetical protein
MRSRSLPFVATLLVLALPAVSTFAASPLQALNFSAKAKVTVQPAPSAAPVSYEADYWVNGDMLRTEVHDSQSKITIGTIMREGTIYSWVFGQETGTKIPSDSPEGASSVNFSQLADCLSKAKKGGDEAIEGVPTTRYTYSNCATKGEATVWIAKTGGYVKKQVLKKEGMVLTAVFANVDLTPVSVEKFNPPQRIPFVGIPKTPPPDAAPKK